MAGPLTGIRVIDLTSTIMGPYGTQLLGDLGADVIKIEPPQGDVLRQVGASRSPGMGSLYLNNNRSKKSIQLDLKQEEGREVLLNLCKTADVFIYNMRPQAMSRLNLDYEALAAVNPKIIYTGVHGFGEQGSYALRPAYDDLIQAGCGLAHLFSYSSEKEEPAYVPNAIADRVGGLMAITSILAALLEREKSQVGQKIQIPMFETMVHFVMSDHLSGLTFEPAMGEGGYGRQLSPHRKPYRTLDSHIGVLFYTDRHWERFFTAIGEEEKFRTDERYSTMELRQKHVDSIYAELDEIFAQKTTAEWMEILIEADVPAMILHDFETLLEDPHLKEVGFFSIQEHPTEGKLRTMKMPATFSRTPAVSTTLAPNLGEHTHEILTELGLGQEQIAELAKKGVVN